MSRLSLLLVPALAAIVLAGCGDSASGGDTAAETATAKTREAEAPSKPPVQLDVRSPDDGAEVRRDRITLKGKTESGADVLVEDTPADVAADGSWSQSRRLHLGSQDFQIAATMRGRTATYERVTVVRRRNAAELAALRQRREEARQRRIAAAQQAEADFKASATTVPYNQLEKNADGYRGTKVVYRGQIFQIQESSYGGGFMLLSVSDQGYGFWDDNIWVNYEGHISGAEEDVITVYGVITGSKSYETQIGGETYVPRMRARYVDE
ncbi:hypothetical protein [Capillimicrobium parvum]|uniref:Lipoprotein n=1 Tax=Capillimicrobium parvum TaxID=2884022 RepID=A0A9E6Y2V4_9ACTN|nr:hypothetical protein [Capillimicrobium parvum]UGS38497.1 hypothetical protein DSM104329_04926 [Capillimicrobium parvum]